MSIENNVADLNRFNAELEQAETEMKILIGGAVIDTGILDVLNANQVLEHLINLRGKTSQTVH